jgi:Xaa-Pro aminopeptidase
MVSLGLLSGTIDDLVSEGGFRRYYMHRTSHWLGLDVHDAGSYSRDGAPRPLEPGMVFTIEPGLYLDPAREAVRFALLEYDAEARRERRYLLGREAALAIERDEREAAASILHPVPAELRGIGVRIEDDVLITTDGCEILTAEVPRSVADVEATLAETPRYLTSQALN